uniref:NADH dehydrogenase subunit 2 n=1 Tax=Alectorobius peruvianus TaxID=879266 RepID=UPI0022381A39|nr:NADH dehydrogenase subunit 2 [Alectorobius peruvianus]UYB78522.1 NADH dehydrogenase subunit 2 [Alectorobius peruvianus]
MMTPTLIFLWFLGTSALMALSSSSLFLLWICLEINMMSFIPLMYSKNYIAMNSTLLYFLTQSSASSIYILAALMLYFNPSFMSFSMILVMITMLIKLGAAPFHIWFPKISEGLDFNSLAILLTVQKMIPLHIMSLLKNKFLVIFIIISALVGSLGGFTQFTLRKILAFSSISHLAWMLSLLLLCSNFWLIYLLIYSSIIWIMTNIMNIYNMNAFNSKSKKVNEVNLFMIVTLLSLGGMPPSVGFIMKWFSMKVIIYHLPTLMVPLILSTIINLFFYLRLAYVPMLKNFNSPKWEMMPFPLWIPLMIFQISSIFFFIAQI